MTEDALASAKMKVAWGKRRLLELSGEINEFLKTKSHGTKIELDPTSGWHTLTTEVLRPLDPDWPLIAGDGIQNLRNALDHVAWAFALSNCGDVPDRPTEVSFPISTKRRSFLNATVKNWVDREQFSFMEERQPFRNAVPENDPLYVLRELSNRDKHRVLHTTKTFLRGDEDISFSFDWDGERLGQLLEEDFYPETESMLTHGTEFGRVRFEIADPEAHVRMSAQAPLLVAFGDSAWNVALSDIGLLVAIVEKIVEDAAELL